MISAARYSTKKLTTRRLSRLAILVFPLQHLVRKTRPRGELQQENHLLVIHGWYTDFPRG